MHSSTASSSRPSSLKLHGFYVYLWCYTDAAGVARDCAVCFKAAGAVQQTAWLDLCEEVSKGPEVPDSVLLVYLKEDIEEFAKGKDDHNFVNSLVRFRNRFPCYSLSFSLLNGDLACNTVQSSLDAAEDEIFFTLLVDGFQQMLLAGLERIFSTSQILVSAPSGFEFVRHSGKRLKRSRVFLRAEQGLTDTAVVSFVALEIWRRFIGSNTQRIPHLDSIYVDTMGISPVAFALREFFGLADIKTLPQVESFHSYGGMEKVRISNKAKTLCLISASTSMNMHRDWVKTHDVEPNRAIMLVTAKDAKDSKYALVTLDDSRLKEVIDDEADSAPYSIQITGETFVPNLEGAKAVLIGLKHSLLDKDSKHKKNATNQSAFYESAALLVHGSATDSNPAFKTIFIDSAAIANDQSVRNSLINTTEKFGFAKSELVIYADDSASKVLAEHLATYLSLKADAMISATEIAAGALAKFSRSRAIIVGAVVGQGSQFLGISRDLRSRHKGDRLYWAGIHIPSTFANMAALAKNLEKTKAGEGAYRFATFCSLPCGNAGAASFKAELSMLEKFPHFGWPDWFKKRTELLKKSRLNGRNLGFLPTGLNLDLTLQLRQGFSFWPPEYAEGPWTGAVLWAIGALLQSARENVDLPKEMQLRSTALNQVLLDPENFSRFNDGIVQAAILRMSLNHELDYRVHPDMSDQMRRFITRMFRNIGDLNSEAVLEFLVALACEKLRLHTSDLLKLVEECRNFLRPQNESEMKTTCLYFLSICADRAGMSPVDHGLEEREF